MRFLGWGNNIHMDSIHNMKHHLQPYIFIYWEWKKQSSTSAKMVIPFIVRVVPWTKVSPSSKIVVFNFVNCHVFLLPLQGQGTNLIWWMHTFPPLVTTNFYPTSLSIYDPLGVVETLGPPYWFLALCFGCGQCPVDVSAI